MAKLTLPAVEGVRDQPVTVRAVTMKKARLQDLIELQEQSGMKLERISGLGRQSEVFAIAVT